MKRMRYLGLLSIVLLQACELDNFDGPNATFTGSILDKDTKELVEQDIVEGTKIYYHELGWTNPEQQQMVIKTDGTFMNKLMFAGEYDFYFNERNFVKPDTLRGFQIARGTNVLNLEVQPYIRVAEAAIVKADNKIVATFTVKPTVDNKVKTIGLFAHIDNVVGDRFKLVETKEDIDRNVDAGGETFTLEIDLSSTNGQRLKEGQVYFFRVGAVIDGAATRYNYAPAVQIEI